MPDDVAGTAPDPGPDPGSDPGTAAAPGEPRQRGSRVALAGVVFAALFVAGWLLLQRSPSVQSTDQELLDYLSRPDLRRGSRLAGLYIVPFAGIAFIWFLAAFRDRIVRAGGREHTIFATVQLVAGSVFVTAVFAVGASELATVWVAESMAPDRIDLDAMRPMIAFGAALAQIVAVRSSAVFIAVSTTRARRAGLFPTWFAVVGWVMAAALLVVASTWRPVVLVIPAWVLGASIAVLSSRPASGGVVDA
jgi:hypothetical protein